MTNSQNSLWKMKIIEGIKELEEKISNYWNNENLSEEGFMNVIIDSSLSTALKWLKKYEGASNYIIPNIHWAGFQDLYYVKIIRINNVLQIDKIILTQKSLTKELKKWLVEYSILSTDRPREYKNSGENIEII
ncbi:12829_t:CDS:2, partial [Funneliformis geosporum]